MQQSTEPIHDCPLDRLRYTGRCQSSSCPYHTVNVNIENGCMHAAIAALPQGRFDLALRLTSKTLSVPGIEQARLLASQALDLNHVLDNALPGGICQSCGYLRPCASKSVCREREAAASQIATRLGHTLPTHALWFAVVHGRHSFLRKEMVQSLASLCSQQDLNKPASDTTP